MGSIKIGNSGLGSAFYGSTEIAKIYYGTTLVYEKYTPPASYTAYCSKQQCTTDLTFPYTMNAGSDITVNITATISAPTGTHMPKFRYFDYFRAGTTSGSHDLVNYTYNNHTNTSTPSVTVSNVQSDIYFDFVYQSVDMDGTAVEITATKPRGSMRGESTRSIPNDFFSSNSYPVNSIKGKYVKIIGNINARPINQDFELVAQFPSSSGALNKVDFGTWTIAENITATLSGYWTSTISGGKVVYDDFLGFTILDPDAGRLAIVGTITIYGILVY